MAEISNFIKKIQQARKSKKLTQAQLAEKVGLTEKHISKIETGVHFPTYKTLNKILKALDLDIEDVGFDLGQVKSSDTPFCIKSLKILSNAITEEEQKYYYGALRQAQKEISKLPDKTANADID